MNRTEYLEAIIAAVREITPETCLADREEIAAALERLLPPPPEPVPEWVTWNIEFAKRQAESRQAIRRAKWLRDRGLTEASADLFRGGRYDVTPTCRDWAERIALLVQQHQAVTTAEVLSMLDTNQREHKDHVRVGRILRALGWERRRIGKGAARQYRYTPPATEPRISVRRRDVIQGPNAQQPPEPRITSRRHDVIQGPKRPNDQVNKAPAIAAE